MREKLSLIDACERVVPVDDWRDWLDAHNAPIPQAPLWIGGASRHDIVDHRDYVAALETARSASSAAISGITQSIFASGAWLAWGFILGGNSVGTARQKPSPIAPSEWRRFDVINFERGAVASRLGNVGYEGICCAPLLSLASARDAETVLAGLSLSEVVERFILADPEVQNLYHPSRQKQELEIFADGFMQATAQGVQLPLSDKPAIAASLLPTIAPLVMENAEAIADVLARRFDALAYFLETLHVTWGGEVEPELLGADFERSTARLDLTDCSIVGAEQNALPVTGIRFALPPKANDLSVSDSKPKGGRPRIYDDHLAALFAEVVANPRKAEGLTSKAAICREVSKRASGANTGDAQAGKKVEKALGSNSLAQSSMECIISFAKKLP